ncbi:MAG: acyl-CoA dehydrogenase family protein [Pseudomonadota bacterium]
MQFSEEQTLLLETAQRFCRERSSIADVRAAIDKVDTFDHNLWQQIVDMGWLSVAVPEEFHGLGMGLAGLTPIAESMGRYLLGSPWLATTLAQLAVLHNGDADQQQHYLAQLQGGDIGTVALVEADGNWDLTAVQSRAVDNGQTLGLEGGKCQVLDAAAADVLVVSVKLDGVVRLLVIHGDQLPAGCIQREVVLDETRRSYTLALDGLQIPKAQLLAGTDLQAIEHAALLLLCAEMAGGQAGALATIIEYLNTRKQFDKLIGSYQALKHPTVDILLAGEAAKSYAYHAAEVADRGDRAAADTALRMAKAHCSEAFAYAGDRAVQFHGGFGFTYDCDAQLYLRRAIWAQHQYGDERHHRQLLAPALLDTDVTV